MKKAILILTVSFTSLFSQTCNSQTNSSIAVSNPSVQGMFITQKLASKLMNIELTKLNLYKVYDEFDMAEITGSRPDFTTNCFGLNCLTNLGTELKVDYIMFGSFDKIGNKIVITIKIIDIKNKTIYKTIFKEFDNQEAELQRMIEIELREMHELINTKETLEQLSFKNEVITSNNLGRINNSGPRIGYAFLTGSLAEFSTRSTKQGGLDIAPSISMIGYQFEKQYVGTENFSALFETIINISGLEQSRFMPSVAFMNGFRFGRSGWEFAFGPSLGLKKSSIGFFDIENTYGDGNNAYWSDERYAKFDNENYINANPFNSTTQWEEYQQYNNTYKLNPSKYSSEENFDNNGKTNISTRFVFGIGRTFRTGALNIPVNIFYSSVKKGSMIGISVGFNVLKKKEQINRQNYE